MTGDMDLTRPWWSYRYAVVDVEGNGQRPPDLVELGVVTINGGEIASPREWLVLPARPITATARRFHKISNQDVQDRPIVAQVAHEMTAALIGHVFVAHNAHVDLDVVRRELGFTPEYVIDTLKLARRLVPGQVSYKLGHLVEAFNLTKRDWGVPQGMTPHRAGYDALMCARLLKVLAEPEATLTLADMLDNPPKSPEGTDAPALF